MKPNDGSWMNEWGACKVCGGELPHGHSENCDMFLAEQKTKEFTNKFSYLLPAFPPQDFDCEAFIVSVIESELKTLKNVRDVLKDHLHKVPKEIKLLPERIKYLLDH